MRTGFFHIRGGIESAIARGLAYAPYADLIWCETSHPDLEEARQFANAIRAKVPPCATGPVMNLHLQPFCYRVIAAAFCSVISRHPAVCSALRC